MLQAHHREAERRLAWLAVSGVLIYAALDVGLAVLRPDVSLLHDPESDYGNGPWAWVMDVNFLVRCGLSIAVVVALSSVLVTPLVGRLTSQAPVADEAGVAGPVCVSAWRCWPSGRSRRACSRSSRMTFAGRWRRCTVACTASRRSSRSLPSPSALSCWRGISGAGRRGRRSRRSCSASRYWPSSRLCCWRPLGSGQTPWAASGNASSSGSSWLGSSSWRCALPGRRQRHLTCPTRTIGAASCGFDRPVGDVAAEAFSCLTASSTRTGRLGYDRAVFRTRRNRA